MKKINSRIQELTWEEARPYIAKVDKKLVQIIDQWKPDKSYKLYSVKYQYNDLIADQGRFQLPLDNGEVVPLSNTQVSPVLKRNLSYRTIPLGILIDKGCEVFMDLENNRVANLAFFSPGVLLGLWETLDEEASHYPKNLWSVSAGARTAFLLPKATEANSYNVLRQKYHLRVPPPKRFTDQSKVFAQICKHKSSECTWESHLIFFSEKWIQQDEANIGWLRFHYYLHKSGWNLFEYNRNTISFERFWQLFEYALEEEGYKKNKYLIDLLKHYLAVASGVVPGFVPATDEVAVPAATIQKAYIEDYKLKFYLPTIMVPGHFDKYNGNDYVYSSLQLPTFLNVIPKSRDQMTLMQELREFKFLVETFYTLAKEDKLKIKNIPLDKAIKNVRFDYFHNISGEDDSILPCGQIAHDDRRFISCQTRNPKNRIFCESSQFFHGCIRFSYQQD